MPLTVLSDRDVKRVLDGLNKQDVLDLQSVLVDALHDYSTTLNAEDSGCCAANQPSRTSVTRKDGTTLFMPATTDEAFGVKTVTLAERCSLKEHGSLPFRSHGSSRSESPARTMTRSSTSSSSNTRDSVASSADTPSLGMLPDLTSGGSQADAPPAETSPKGSLTLFTPDGVPRALINASTLTAFRTALASTLLFKLRTSVRSCTVFGAGLQAYWHIFCMLILRGEEIAHLTVINRDFERAQSMYMRLAQSRNRVVNNAFLGKQIKPGILTPRHGEYTRLLKEYVRSADMIVCCTPSTQPLFPAGYLTHTEGRRKGRFIVAIGSYKPHMQELPSEILRQAVGSSDSHGGGLHLHHRHANEGGAVVVDTIEGAMSEAGEVINSGIGGKGLVELGELVMLKRSHWAEKAKREHAEREKKQKEGKEKHHGGGHGIGHLFHHNHHEKEKAHPQDFDGGLKDWLERGNVIYKSVGLGLMDVVVGMEIVRLAEQRGIGATVDDF